MFIVLLKFSDNKGKASQFMEGHQEWIKRGFDDGVFLLVGSLQPNLGGGIVAHNTSLPDLQSRVNDDPFVVENVVNAEILEITPSKADAAVLAPIAHERWLFGAGPAADTGADPGAGCGAFFCCLGHANAFWP
jgi:uncharacterized protein YciI